MELIQQMIYYSTIALEDFADWVSGNPVALLFVGLFVLMFIVSVVKRMIG